MICKMRHTKSVLLLLCTVYSTIHARDTQTGVELQLRFDSYPPNAQSMVICIDHRGGNDAFNDCSHYKFVVNFGFWGGIRYIPQPPYSGAISNPLAFDMDQYEGGFKIKLIIWHHFSIYGDSLYRTIDAMPYLNHRNATYHKETLEYDSNPTRYFSFLFMVYCEPNYYGEDCGRYCEEDNYAEIPYSCDPKTGEKIYPPGREPKIGECPDCKPGMTCISLGSTAALALIITTLVFVILKYYRGPAAARRRATETEENSRRFFSPIYMGDLTGFLRPNDTDPKMIAEPKRASGKPLPGPFRHVGHSSEMEMNLDVEADNIWPMQEEWLSTFTPSTSAGATPY